MDSISDPPRAGWDRVATPPGDGPVVVRARGDVPRPDPSVRALLDDVTAGLAARFPCVLPVDVTVGPRDVRRGAVRVLHAAVDERDRGLTIETLLRADGDLTCWVALTSRYTAELETARRMMAGRPVPPHPAGAPSAGRPLDGEPPTGGPWDGESWAEGPPRRVASGERSPDPGPGAGEPVGREPSAGTPSAGRRPGRTPTAGEPWHGEPWAARTWRAAAAGRSAGERPPAGAPPGEARVDAMPPGDAPSDAGVPVAEGRLVVARPRTGPLADVWVFQRRGPLAQVLRQRIPAVGDGAGDGRDDEPGVAVEDGTESVRLHPSALPVWLWAVTGAGPRPAPAGRRMLITLRSALDRLLTLDRHDDPARCAAPDADAVRAVLADPDLPDRDAARLAALVRGLTAHWRLDWTSGRDDAQEPADEEWSTARVLRCGGVEVLDAGTTGGLWRVLTDLPAALTADGPPPHPASTPVAASGAVTPSSPAASRPAGTTGRGRAEPTASEADEPVALVQVAAAGLWAELTRPVTG